VSVQLIVADLDGTLLNQNKQFSADLFPLLRQLRKRDIRFAPASGRQYFNLRELFAPVADNLFYIAENGAMVCEGTALIAFETMPVAEVQQAVRIARENPGMYAILACQEGAYYEENHDSVFLENMSMYYPCRWHVPDLLDIAKQQPVCKIAVFCAGHAEDRILPAYQSMASTVQVALSGVDWADLMRSGVDKGSAFCHLCQTLQIDTADCMVFGDYLNDLELIQSAGESYAMANGHPALKAAAKYVCPSNEEDGVCRTIRAALGLSPGASSPDGRSFP